MRLNAKDATATAVLAVAGGFYAWHLARPDTAVVGSPRWTALVLFGLGVVSCATGAALSPSGSYERMMSTFAALPFLLMLTVLVTESEAVLVALAASIAAMWLVTTVRHAVGPRTAPPAPPAQPRPRELQHR